jgi:molybdopterin-guanine dinucleotide biosynthesis protein A
MTGPVYAAVVLAGGAGRRLGGVVKPALRLGGRSLLDRVLTAVPDAWARVVVGPPELSADLPAGVLLTREEPAGGGPVAACAAGIALLPPEATYVALLAADLPFLTTDAVSAICVAATAQGVDGAVFVDEAGRRQSLCGVWRVAALASRLAAVKAQRGRLDGASLRELLDGLHVAELSTVAGKASAGRPGTAGAGEPSADTLPGTGDATLGVGVVPPPWFDCDTEADLRRGERWVDGHAG